MLIWVKVVGTIVALVLSSHLFAHMDVHFV